jgi:hypothetical protein
MGKMADVPPPHQCPLVDGVGMAPTGAATVSAEARVSRPSFMKSRFIRGLFIGLFASSHSRRGVELGLFGSTYVNHFSKYVSG